MQVTGFQYREIYPQTGVINYSANISIDSLAGQFYFGFSGDNNSVNFVGNSGKFCYITGGDNLFLQSYQANIPFSISGAIGSNSHDFSYNNSPLFLGLQKNTGILNKIFANSSNCITDISLKIDGGSPEYSYSPLESYYSGQNIPVTINNLSNQPFKIFSGNSLNNNFILSGASDVTVNNSLTLYLVSNSFTNGAQSVPIELFTDFGRQQIAFTASGQSLEDVGFYLIFGPDIPNVKDGSSNQYTLLARNLTGLQLGVYLEYVSGATGQYYAPIEAINSGYTGNASGLITGSGIITGQNTGPVYYNNPLTGIESGIGTGIFEKYVYSSGRMAVKYETILTGLGSGLLPITSSGTGYTNININTIVGPQGRIINLSDLTGIGTGIDANYGIFTGQIFNGATSVFVPYTGNITGIQVIIPSGSYESISYTGDLLYYTGQISKFYNITGVTYVTGETVTGLLQGDFGNIFEPGIYTFYKGFTGIGSGTQAILESFDPIKFTVNSTGTSGIISGIFYNTVDATSCSFEPTDIVPSGIPLEIFGPTGNKTYPLSIFHLQPNDTGEYLNENSAGVNPRTSISRNGVGPSGSGYFDNVYREPFYESGTWTEYISGNTTITTGTTRAYINNLNISLQMVNSTGLSGYFTISGENNYYQTYKWQGGVKSGDFNDYSLELYKQVGTSISLLKKFYTSYDVDLILNNGTYFFNIIPLKNSQEVPSLLLPKTYYLSSYEKQTNIPSILTQTINDNIYVMLSGEDNTAVKNVHYSINNNLITLDKNFGVKNLPISLLAEPSSDVKFYLHVNYLSGGKISNANSLSPIEVNILKTEYGESLFPTTANGGCCPEPTGISQVTCQSYLGNNIAANDGNGVFSYFIKFPRPLSQYESLSFYNKFNGKNDIYSLDALLSNGSPVNLYTSSITQDTDISVLNNFNIPSTSYGIRYTVLGGALNIKNNRANWSNSFYCDNSPIGTSGCNGGVSNVRVVSDNPMNNGFIINRNSVNVYSGNSLDITIPNGTNIGDFFEVYTKSDKLSPFSVLVNYSGGGYYNNNHIFNGAADRIGSSSGYSSKVLGTVRVGSVWTMGADQTWQKQAEINFGKTPINSSRTAVSVGFIAPYTFWKITELTPTTIYIDLPPIKIGEFSIDNICPPPYEECLPTGIHIKSLGQIDDDFYVKVGDKYLYNKQLNASWYSGEQQIWYPPLSFGMSDTSSTTSTGVMNFNLKPFNGFDPTIGDPIYIRSWGIHFSGTVMGYGVPTGIALNTPSGSPSVVINLSDYWPLNFSTYYDYGYPLSGQTFGPYSEDMWVFTCSDFPAQVDDYLNINGSRLILNAPATYIVPGGVTECLYFLPKGQPLTMNIYNSSYGPCWGYGAIKLYNQNALDGSWVGNRYISVLPEITSVTPYTGQFSNVWGISNQNFGTLNLDYSNTGFREISISRGDAGLQGLSFMPGTQIDIGCNDGWPGMYVMSPWEAKVLYKNGYYILTGGANETGYTPVGASPMGNTGQLYYYYFQNAPVEYKHPNGGLIL